MGEVHLRSFFIKNFSLFCAYNDTRAKRAMLRRAMFDAHARKQPLTFDDQELRELQSNEAIRIIPPREESP